MSKRVVVLFLASVFVFSSFSCKSNQLSREYYDDIIYPLQDFEKKLIIKEWHFLLGSGAEIYYQCGRDSPVLLGETNGADNGYCPFKNGEYTITQNGNMIEISWLLKKTDSNHVWRSKTFELPIVF